MPTERTGVDDDLVEVAEDVAKLVHDPEVLGGQGRAHPGLLHPIA